MKIKHRLIAAALAPALLLLAALFPANALAVDGHAIKGDATTVKVPVSVTTSGQGIPGETYTVKIEAETDGAPMPSTSEIDVKGEELKAGTYKGDPAEFDLDFSKARVGIYKYRISQVAPENTTGRGEYDSTVYYMTVTYEHPDGDMSKTLVTAAVHEGTPEGTKVAVCNFTNTYANLPAGEIDPPVTKKIAGDKPAKKSTFDFVLESIDGARCLREQRMASSRPASRVRAPSSLARSTTPRPARTSTGATRLTRARTGTPTTRLSIPCA